MRKVLKLMLIVVLAACFVIVLAACNNDGSSATSITNLSYNGDVISWTSVKNAKSYKIRINNGGERTVQQADGTVTYQYDAEGADFDFSIEAVVKEGSNKNPKYSIKFRFLGKVEGLALSDGVLTWTDIESADGYEIKYNNSLLESSVPTNSYATVGTGTFNYQIRAIKVSTESTDGNDGYYSVWSDKLQGTILTAPTNIKYDSETITWSAVTNASGYTVKIGNEEYQTSGTSYSFAAGLENFDLSIKAKGTNSANDFYDSKYSEAKTYTYLAPVSNLNIEDGILKWDAVANATKYRVKLNGNVLSSEISTNAYDAFNAGTSYTIQIMPVGSSDFYFSHWSNQMTVTLLQEPTLGFTDNAITWNQIGNGAGYHLIIEKGGNVIAQQDMSDSTFTYLYPFNEAGDYTVKIKTTTTAGTGYYESKYSLPLSVKRLGAPTQHNITNSPLERDNVLVSFNDISGADSYAIEANGVQINSVTRNSFEIGLSTDALEKVVTINVRSKGKVNLSAREVILDSINTLTFNVTKLAIPQNMVISGTQISWDSVNNNNGYIVDVDGTRYQATGTTFTLPTVSAGTHMIRVRTRGNGEAVCSSDYSNNLNVTKLAKPANLVITNQNLTWGIVTGALSYRVIIGAEEVTAGSNAYNLLGRLDSITEGSGMQISVYAIGNGTTIINSDVSDTRTISRLARPSAITVNNNNIIWNPTVFNGTNITQYRLYIDGDMGGIGVSGTSYSLASFASGEHTVQVQAVGNNSDNLDSPLSNAKTFTKLGQVAVEKSGNKYTWEPVAGAVRYEYKLSASATPQFTTVCEITPNWTVGGTFAITIRALGDDGQTSVAGDAVNFEQVIAAISTPAFTYTVSGNTATISVTNPTAGANYKVEIGGVLRDMTNGVYELIDNDNLHSYIVRVKVAGGYFVEDGKYMIDSNFSAQQTVNIP